MALNRWNEWIKNHSGLAGAVLFFLTSLVYAGSLANGFVYDDELQILENPFVLNPTLWQRIFLVSVRSYRGTHVDYYRPLQIFLYSLLYRIAGPNPGVFHLFHLLLYGATVWLTFKIGRALLQNELAAFFGALLWALHPLHVEAVAWLASSPEIGFAFFYLWAFLLFLRAEKAQEHQNVRHTLAALVYLPALFFKEMALSFPLLLVVHWFFVPGRSTGADWLRRLLHGIPYCLAVGVELAIRNAVVGHFALPSRRSNIVQLSGAAAGLLGEHTRLFFWPTHLNVFRAFDVSSSLHSPWVWVTLLVAALTLVLRRREPLLGFLLIWWAVTLLPALDIRYLSYPLLAERFSYLPSVGLCVAIAFVGFLWLPRHAPSWVVPRVVVAGLAVIAVCWGAQTIRAIPHWRETEILVQYSIKQSPDAAPLHVIQGLVLQYRRGDIEGAVREYQTALRLNAASPRPAAPIAYNCYLSLGEIALAQGRREEAAGYFERATRLIPDVSDAYVYLGTLYFPNGDYAKAAEYFSQAVKVNAYDPLGRFFLGTCWMKLGKYREAVEQFHAAREVDPSYWQAFDAEARALEALGDSAGAAHARSLKPKL